MASDVGRSDGLPENALSTLCEVSSAILGVADFNGRLRWVNAAWMGALGYSRDELLALPSYLDLVHPEDVPEVLELIGSLAQAGVGPSVTVRVRHKHGPWRWFRSSAIAVGELVYFSGADVTEERRHADELDRVNASLRLFSVGVAHDLRSLLSVVQGAADELVPLAREDPQGPEVGALGDTLRRNAARASVFVGALLAVTRGEAIEREVIGVADLVDAAAQDVAADLDASGASIRHEPDLPSVWVNPVLIRSTLANLFANAIRYCNSGVVPEILVEARANGARGMITVSVSDNGPGIPETDLAAVFEIFERRSPQRTSPDASDEHLRVPHGYGLGLALCRQVVAAHGGHVWATSEPGAGTTMTMELPAGSSAPS